MPLIFDRLGERIERVMPRLEALLFPLHRTLGYQLAVVFAMVSAGFLVRELIGPPELGVPFLTFFPAAAISAVFGGFWAGMLATVLGASLATYFYIPPYSMFSFEFRYETVFGNLVYFVDELIVCSAIAALYRFNRKTKDQNLELNTLIQTIPDLMWLKNPQGAYLVCNPAIERFFGLSRRAIVGKTSRDLLPAAQAEAIHIQDQAALNANATHMHEAWVTRASDGAQILLETITTPMRAADGNTIGILGIARDITLRRRLENELQARTVDLERERAFLSAIFEHTGDGILVVGGDGCIALANQQARRLLGLMEDAVFWPEWAAIAKSAPSDSVFRHDLDSVGRVLSLSATRTDLAAETHYIIIARDVSEERRVADERRELDRQMFQMEKMVTLGELAMGVAHEIGNPLGGMKVVAQSLQYEDNLSGETREALGRLEAEIDRLGDFLRCFHGFAAPQQPRPVACRFRDIVDDLLFWTRKEAASHNVAIGLMIDKTLMVNADPNQIKQVLLNLIVNAIHAMPEGGVLGIRARNENGDGVLIEIADTGVGIDPNIQGRIFDPFFTTRATGSGLGLAVVKKIVGQHGARIEISSQLGHGTCITLHWPAA